MIRSLIVDDHAILRRGLRTLLSDAFAGAQFGEASNAEEALEQLEKKAWDVALLDISMPGGSGLDGVGVLLARVPTVRVLMLSVHDDLEYTLESVRAGAHGYLRKDSTPAELRDAIATVHAGEAYFSPQVARQLAEAIRTGAAAPTPKPAQAVDVLTAREIEVLRHVADGFTNREIGTMLGISVRTAEAHRDSLMRKLEVHTVAGLTRLALEQNIIGGKSRT